MQSAPRDGTAVELCCTYGIAPWYGIFHWADEMQVGCRERLTDGAIRDLPPQTIKLRAPTWAAIGRPGHSVSNEAHLCWRPLTSDPLDYLDPTGGAQDTPDYWRKASGI